MRAACLLYHDVVESADWDSSGFTGPGTAKYKLSRPEFEAHLAAIAKVRDSPASTAHELANLEDATFPFLLTFDDGGESAATRTAELLGKHGWLGHFFVTAGQINKKGFLNPEQIRSLRKKGHVIGSHSFSHPVRMSHCSQEELTTEWASSIQTLSDILGEQVDTASVPGGYYSKRVAETAAAAGIRVLFNSEPTTAVYPVLGCIVVGRFNIFRGMPPGISGELVSVQSPARTRQWLHWNLKKLAKIAAGRPYLAARQWLLRKG
ncbi:MAG: polysaccharide deacetylase family protein [Terriglobales bacterium]|jgi:peptidoglycan/xylan/chitin deacetylase (PgdA/CDA1 family)